MRARRMLCAAIASAAVGSTLLFLGSAAAAPGDFDPTFGTDGVVETAVGQFSSSTGVAVQPDGKIVLGGSSSDGFTLVRYLPDGTRDIGFGSTGIVTGPFGQADALAIQPDGKLLLAGWSHFGFTVVRYDTDGELDTSFGSGGIAHIPGAGATAVAVQPDGRIVVVGASTETDGSSSMLVARFTSSGSLDLGFGKGGVVKTPIGGSSAAGSVALQTDGKIVVGGMSASDHWQLDGVVTIARYDVDGSLDPSFGSGGTMTTSISTSTQSGPELALQPDGKVVVLGATVLGRYMQDGSVDTSFGSVGTITTGIGAGDVLVQADGRILVTGAGENGFVVSRFEANGSPDLGFGDAGVVGTTFGWYGAGRALALQPDGRIVAAGYAGGPGGWHFAVVRYLATSPSSISGHPVEVDYGQSVQLSGTLTTREPGPVTLLRRGCYDYARRVSGMVSARDGGEWTTQVVAGSRTTYWASVNGERSAPLSVNVRPRLTLKRLSRRLVRARVLYGHSLAGELVALQRRRTGSLGWEDIGLGALGRVARDRAGVVSGVTFRVRPRVGGRLRVQIRQTSHYDCFAEAASGSIR